MVIRPSRIQFPEPKNVIFLETELGRIGLAERSGALSDVFFTLDTTLTGAVERSTPLLRQAARQIEDYFRGRRKTFRLPILLSGSDFRRAVLAEVARIPYGQVRSYMDLAIQTGHPRAARAVGTVNSGCPIAIIIPCHRVVRSDGGISGGREDGALRARLLDLERQYA